MKVEHLREFVVFAEYMNFTAAAKRLYMTQPALSYHIAAMERELGFELVERGEALRLTPAGRIVLSEAQVIIARYESMIDQCKEAVRHQAGQVVIERLAGMPLMSRTVNMLVSRFVESHPHTDVKLTRTDGSYLFDVLHGHKADAGIVVGPYDLSDEWTASREISLLPLPPSTDPYLYVLIHSSSSLAHGDQLTAADLEGCVLAFQSDPWFRAGRESLERMLVHGGVNVGFKSKAERDDIDFMWDVGSDEVVISDRGLGDMHIEELPGMSDFVLRRIDDELMRVRPYLAYCANNTNPALAQLVSFARSLESGSDFGRTTLPDDG